MTSAVIVVEGLCNTSRLFGPGAMMGPIEECVMTSTGASGFSSGLSLQQYAPKFRKAL